MHIIDLTTSAGELKGLMSVAGAERHAARTLHCRYRRAIVAGCLSPSCGQPASC
jgi:hypothetical protein